VLELEYGFTMEEFQQVFAKTANKTICIRNIADTSKHIYIGTKL